MTDRIDSQFGKNFPNESLLSSKSFLWIMDHSRLYCPKLGNHSIQRSQWKIRFKKNIYVKSGDNSTKNLL